MPFDDDEVTCSYVTTVVRADGTPAFLKIGMPHMERAHEIHGLRFWDGDPTVRLLVADDDLGAMLLERCDPGTVLGTLPEHEQDLVISGLLRRLWRAPLAQHPFRPLSSAFILIHAKQFSNEASMTPLFLDSCRDFDIVARKPFTR